MITLDDVQAARERIRDRIYYSPCARSKSLSDLYGCEAYLKLDNLQQTGSFKERGALNRLLQLNDEEKQRGVVAASAGNHAQGVAYHAQRLGIRAQIVMPTGTPLAKVSATRGYGADVVLHGANYDEAYEEACRLREQSGAVFVHAFDDDYVIAGQGTMGLEILEQVPEVDVVVVPIGGGGLIGGISTAVKGLRPQAAVIGVEAERLPSMRDSVEAGEPLTLPPAQTIADGIAVKRPGERTLPLVRQHVDEIVTVSDDQISSAILALLEREKTLAEGAGAAGLAAVASGQVEVRGKKVVVVICGGNIDMTILGRVIERGLVDDGRLVMLSIRIADSPGSLARLCSLLGNMSANILNISQVRAFRPVTIGETEVDVSLETKGADHVREIVNRLHHEGYWVGGKRPDRATRRMVSSLIGLK